MKKQNFTIKSVDTRQSALVALTVEQAQIALDCVQNDIALSEFGQIDFADVAALKFYLHRAELMHILQSAIRAAQQ